MLLTYVDETLLTKNGIFRVRCNEKDLEIIRETCQKLGESLSVFVRRAVGKELAAMGIKIGEDFLKFKKSRNNPEFSYTLIEAQ